jgi:uncharacterized protein involved in outer membrane biogenesis
MSIHKKTVTLIAGGVILAVIVIVLLSVLFGPKILRSRIERTASKALGMDVLVRGNVSVSFFPAFGASLADIRVTNGGADVATVASMKIGVKLLPLIMGRVRISRIEMVKPAVSVLRQKDGTLNIVKPKGKWSGDRLDLRKLAISEGSFLYTDLKSDGGIVLEGLDITAEGLSAAQAPDGGLMKTLSFASEVRCRTVKAPGLAMTDLVMGVVGRHGVFDVNEARMNAFGGPGTATLHADFTGAEPQFKVLLAVKQLKIGQLLQESPNAKHMEGLADLTAELTAKGRSPVEVKRSLAGLASLDGENIAVEGIDIDDLIMSLLRSRRFSLVDVGAFFLAGPLGPALTRGYRFADLFQESQGGKGVIAKLVSVWKVENGTAEAVDVAMATKKRRIAMKGGLNFNDNRFEDVVVAVVDQHGCAALTQKVRGPFNHPEIGNINVLKSLTSPLTNLLKSGMKLFSHKPCVEFYSGSVAPPEGQKRP